MPNTDILTAKERAIQQGLSPACLLPFSQGWESPSPQDVRIILQMAALTEHKAGLYVGLDQRTIRRWKSGTTAPSYAGWCLLVYVAGLGMIPG